jgi:hypothetical protein
VCVGGDTPQASVVPANRGKGWPSAGGLGNRPVSFRQPDILFDAREATGRLARFIGIERPIELRVAEARQPQKSPTGLTARIGWHQDLATVVEEADESDFLTVWFPMTKASAGNSLL